MFLHANKDSKKSAAFHEPPNKSKHNQQNEGSAQVAARQHSHDEGRIQHERLLTHATLQQPDTWQCKLQNMDKNRAPAPLRGRAFVNVSDSRRFQESPKKWWFWRISFEIDARKTCKTSARVCLGNGFRRPLQHFGHVFHIFLAGQTLLLPYLWCSIKYYIYIYTYI